MSTSGAIEPLIYQGWRKHPAGFGSGTRIPTASFIQRGLGKRAAAWINVGWYRLDGNRGEYRRVGGHWVTLVGINPSTRQLVVHDPAPRASDGAELVSYRTLSAGRLVGNKSGLPTNASGYLQLGAGMHMPKESGNGNCRRRCTPRVVARALNSTLPSPKRFPQCRVTSGSGLAPIAVYRR